MSLIANDSLSSSKDLNQWNNPIVWIDLEMTGLNPVRDVIVEIAVIVTDGLLKRQVEGPNFVINASSERLASMNEWCKMTFRQSGLLNQIQQSTTTMEEAEKQVLLFLVQQQVPEAIAPLGGNSVALDREFLRYHMPALFSFLNYRILDVSSIKLLKMFWFPNLPNFEKKLTHRALDDIRESIAELEYYRKSILKTEQSNSS